MNPKLEHILSGGEESFFVKKYDLPYFDSPLHYHPEFELVLIINGTGKRFIGNVISDFSEGDLTFIGANLPHLFKNHPEYYDASSTLRAQSVVVQFLQEAIGSDFWKLPQAKKLRKLLEVSKYGVDIVGKTKEYIIPKMISIVKMKGMERIICLLEILNCLANTGEFDLISSVDTRGYDLLDAQRLNAVFEYMLENYHREIKLEEVAAISCMTRTSFCRFFQQRTKRTFSSVLTDIRLNQATKLLIESSMNVSRVGYECGFNNLSNFNRQFKKKFTLSPYYYRKLNDYQ